MGKTYRNAQTERPYKIKRRWKEFRVKRKIKKELEDYENNEEMSDLQKDYSQTNK